jgi:hypothetical protein
VPVSLLTVAQLSKTRDRNLFIDGAAVSVFLRIRCAARPSSAVFHGILIVLKCPVLDRQEVVVSFAT